MNRVVFLSSILWASVGLGGQLREEDDQAIGRQVGTDSYSASEVIVTPFSPLFGETVAYIDLYGTASKMDLSAQEIDENGKATGRLLVVASSQPEDLGNGWERFSFRGLNLKMERKQLAAHPERGYYNAFGDGVGAWVVLHDGSYPVYENHQNSLDPNYLVMNSEKQDQSGKFLDYPLGWPVLNKTMESLDPPFGDATGDGRIDISDFGTLKDGFGQQSSTPYSQGDVNGDMLVNVADFGTLKQNFGWKQGSAVPEPSALGLLGVGALLTFAARPLRRLADLS